MKIDLSKYKGLSIKSFEMVELNGNDSTDAAGRAVGAKATNGWLMLNEHKAQLIAQSITKVNGEDVVRPYVQWMNWSLKTQDYVVEVYDFLNVAPREDMADFRKTVLGLVPPESPAAK